MSLRTLVVYDSLSLSSSSSSSRAHAVEGDARLMDLPLAPGALATLTLADVADELRERTGVSPACQRLALLLPTRRAPAADDAAGDAGDADDAATDAGDADADARAQLQQRRHADSSWSSWWQALSGGGSSGRRDEHESLLLPSPASRKCHDDGTCAHERMVSVVQLPTLVDNETTLDVAVDDAVRRLYGADAGTASSSSSSSSPSTISLVFARALAGGAGEPKPGEHVASQHREGKGVDKSESSNYRFGGDNTRHGEYKGTSCPLVCCHWFWCCPCMLICRDCVEDRCPHFDLACVADWIVCCPCMSFCPDCLHSSSLSFVNCCP